MMHRKIFCDKLLKEANGLDAIPFGGALGERVFNHISKDAWEMWLSQQTMLINEYRLSLIDPKSRNFLQQEMTNFFWGQGSDKPSGYHSKD